MHVSVLLSPSHVHNHTFTVIIAELCSVLDKVSYFKTLEEKQVERAVYMLFSHPYMKHLPDISIEHQ